jgi:uncharacterized membrane protein YdjX (TVP38/TMEM64 family)
VQGSSPTTEAERSRSEDAEPEDEPHPLGAIIGIVGGIVLLAICVLAIEPLRAGIGDAVSGDTDQLRDDLRGLGFGGVMISFLLALAHAVIWYPAEILDLAVGFVYGFWGGLGLVMVGWVANGLLAYWIGRHAARPLLWRFIGHHRFERLEHIVEAGGVTLLLGMRLVPVIPFSLFSIVAGAARADLFTFVWTTAVGYLPLTAIFVYLGSRLEELSLTDPLLWLGAAVLIALLLLTRGLHRRWRGAPQAGADT